MFFHGHTVFSRPYGCPCHDHIKYDHMFLQVCWPPKADDGDSESGEASSAHTGDGEEPWFEATWEGGVRALGPRRRGQSSRRYPQIDTATGIDFNQSLYDFIQERM